MSAEEISGRRVGLFAWLENRMISLFNFGRLLQTRPANSQIPDLRDVKNLNKENDFEQNVSTMSPPPWRWQPFSLVGSLQQRSAFQSHFARRYRCHCLERRFGAVKTKCRAIVNGNGELAEQFQSFEDLLKLTILIY